MLTNFKHCHTDIKTLPMAPTLRASQTPIRNNLSVANDSISSRRSCVTVISLHASRQREVIDGQKLCLSGCWAGFRYIVTIATKKRASDRIQITFSIIKSRFSLDMFSVKMAFNASPYSPAFSSLAVNSTKKSSPPPAKRQKRMHSQISLITAD